MNRLSWEEYALNLAFAASKRSEDPYVKVGACALRFDNSVASVGYNGAPQGIEIDWSDREKRRKFVLHGEQNCLKYTLPNECRLIAVTLLPCCSCFNLIASYKIPLVVYSDIYDKDDSAFELAKKFNIELRQVKMEKKDGKC